MDEGDANGEQEDALRIIIRFRDMLLLVGQGQSMTDRVMVVSGIFGGSHDDLCSLNMRELSGRFPRDSHSYIRAGFIINLIFTLADMARSRGDTNLADDLRSRAGMFSLSNQ